MVPVLVQLPGIRLCSLVNVWVPKCIDPLSSRVTEDGAEVAEGRRHARVVLPEAGLRDFERTTPFFFIAT